MLKYVGKPVKNDKNENNKQRKNSKRNARLTGNVFDENQDDWMQGFPYFVPLSEYLETRKLARLTGNVLLKIKQNEREKWTQISVR